ncbi:hypothetical protein PSHT_02210 [Puccinia striiformis]|uniref:Uncharacterized protein n=1 Tax=Puccinia striiformis TaxID=27350 RepID=A0A2S4WII1_9BASI|nr:hypothetical protein PSHT_02210 [Puccinia striiformis]
MNPEQEWIISLAPGPVGLGRFRESSSSSSEWSSEETHSPPPVHFPDQFAHNYLTDNDDRSSASYSDYIPQVLVPTVYIYRAMSLNAHQAMKWMEIIEEAEVAQVISSDSEASYSPAGSPMSYSDGLSSSEHEMDDSDSSKAPRINYFDYFARQKLMPLPEDEYYHKPNPDVVEEFYTQFSRMLKYKTTGYPENVERHEELPFGLVTHAFPYPGRPSEVLLPDSDRSLRLTSRPVLGLSRYSFGSESIDDIVLKPTQIELIKYFSQYHHSNPKTEPTVSNLLKAYNERPEIPPVETMPMPRPSQPDSKYDEVELDHLSRLVEHSPKFGRRDNLIQFSKFALNWLAWALTMIKDLGGALHPTPTIPQVLVVTQHISDDEFEQLSGDEMESRSSRRRRLPKSYPSDSEASYSPPQSPMSYSGGLSSSEDEMDGSDSSKAERINYFDYFAKQKLMPLPEDEYYHKIQPDIIQAFYNKFSEMLVHKTRGRRDVVTPHKELPFGLVTHALPFPGRPSEVLLPRSSATQTREGWQDLYLKLITSLSERHAKDYKAARVLKTQYRAEQIRLLNWLDKEIFAPYQSLPVLGLSRYSFGSESIDDIKLKPTQIELIKYFSQYHYRSQTEPTVSNLMEAYKKRPAVAPVETMPRPRGPDFSSEYLGDGEYGPSTLIEPDPKFAWLALDGNATPFTHRLAKPDRLPSWIISGSLTNWHNADRALRAPTLVSSPVATGLLRNSLRIRRLTKSYGAP